MTTRPLPFRPASGLRPGSPFALVVGLALCMASLVWTPPAQAQRSGQQHAQLDGVGVTQNLGADLPTDLTFRNEDGEPVQLDQYFDGSAPVILTFNYHRCPQLCKVQLRKFAESLSGLSWTPGDTFRVVTVDINPDEGPKDAREAKDRYSTSFDRPDDAMAGWHFLTGKADAIERLTDAAGFRYERMENGEYAHPATLVFASGEGTITRYFTTLNPQSSALRTALVEASDGEIGSLADQAFLACAQFNPDSNSYSASAFKLMQYGTVFLTLLMGTALFLFWRRENKQLDAAEQDPNAAFETALRERT